MAKKSKKKYRKSFRQHWKEEFARMKPMNWKERLDHLWTYYHDYLWVAAVAVILIAAIISSTINLLTDNTQVRGVMVNISIEQQGMNYLKGEYAKALDVDKDEVQLSYIEWGTVADLLADDQNYTAAMSVTSEVAAEMLDYMILDEEAMIYYRDQGVYGDMTDMFSPEELAQMDESRLQRVEEETSGEEWLIAIDISDTAYVKDNSEGKVYFAIAGNAPHPDMCRKVWDRIMAWEPLG